MDLGVDGRVALVLGASAGMGRAIAAELAAEGARVAVASRTPERIEAAATAIGHGTRAYVHDNANLDAAAALVDAVEADLGPLDILVTNTGGPPPNADPLGFTREQWLDAYRTLVLAPITFIQRALPGMRERGFGRIVNVSSSAVREPISTLMLSSAHRTGLLAAFKTIARHVAPEGVTVNTVLPGRIATDRLFSTHGGRPAAQARAAREVPAGRLGTPEEFAAVVAFLCSARASYVTGTALLVDGGLTVGV